MFYKNPCKAVANPRKRKSAAKRKASPKKRTQTSMAKTLNKLCKDVKKLCALENPRKSFPKTKVGRKPVTRSWVIEMFDTGNKKLGAHIVKRTKAAAEKVAKSGVGKKFRGKTIHRVVLDGPH